MADTETTENTETTGIAGTSTTDGHTGAKRPGISGTSDCANKPVDPEVKEAFDWAMQQLNLDSKYSLQYASAQCGVTLVLKGAELPAEDPQWRKVEQLNIECETAPDYSPSVNVDPCDTSGSVGNIRSGAYVASNAQVQDQPNPKLETILANTGKTFKHWLGPTSSNLNYKIAALNGTSSETTAIRLNLIRSAVTLDKMMKDLGVTDYTVTNSYRDPTTNKQVNGSANSAHPQGFAFDIQLPNLARTKQVAKQLYTLQKTGKLIANQIIWESHATSGGSQPSPERLAADDIYKGGSNTPGTAPITTPCDPSSVDPNAGMATGGSENTNTGGETGNTSNTTTTPTITCDDTVVNIKYVTMGDEYAVNFASAYLRGEKGPVKTMTNPTMTPTGLLNTAKLAANANVYKGKNVVVSSCLTFMKAGDVNGEINKVVEAVKTLVANKASTVYVLGINPFAHAIKSANGDITESAAGKVFKDAMTTLASRLSGTERVVIMENVPKSYSLNYVSEPLRIPKQNNSWYTNMKSRKGSKFNPKSTTKRRTLECLNR